MKNGGKNYLALPMKIWALIRPMTNCGLRDFNPLELRLSARKTRSKEERGRIMMDTTPQRQGGFTQWFGSCSLNKHFVCVVSANGCRTVGLLIQMASLATLNMGSLPEGFPKATQGGMPGTNPHTRLLVQAEQRQRQKTRREGKSKKR